MGKNFPEITNLKARPHLLAKTLQLIEESFEYQSPHKFQTDFAPLVESSNHQNCFILIDEEENVLGHIGAKEKKIKINNQDFQITLLGGIAIAKEHRGKGFFQDLMQDVLAEKRSDTALFILWSDLEKLYHQFGFFLCGNQFEVPQKKSIQQYTKTTYHELSSPDKKSIQELYQKSFSYLYHTLERSSDDWKAIELITSAELYIQKNNNEITSYFFMNKGQDLQGIIYEYGTTKDINHLINECSSYGKVWMGYPIIETDILQYQFFLGLGNTSDFKKLVSALSNNQVSIREINIMKQEVFFDFNQELLSLQTEDFLRGLIGPGIFEEFGEMKSIFISGLDSI